MPDPRGVFTFGGMAPPAVPAGFGALLPARLRQTEAQTSGEAKVKRERLPKKHLELPSAPSSGTG